MKVDYETGWIYFETDQRAKWRIRTKDIMAICVSNEYLTLWLRSVPGDLSFSRGKPEEPSEANLGSPDGDFLNEETCWWLEKVLGNLTIGEK